MSSITEKTKIDKKNSRSKLWSWLIFIGPAFIFYLAFMLIPSIGAGYYSLTNWNGLARVSSFIGFDNYVEAFTEDPDFVNSIWFTLKYTAIVLVFQNVIALFLAVMIESRTRAKSFFRTIFFMPNMISLIISAFMWVFIFTIALPELSKYGLSILNQGWLGDSEVSFYSIILVSLWRGTGYMMIIYIAALQGVPKHLKEAAVIDGASPFQSLLHVTVPMIMHAITICIFLTLNESFKVFDLVYGLTGGGPGRSTQVIALNIYDEAFSNNFRYGYANAKAMILFGIVLIITFFQVRVMKNKEVEA
jgi:raffinose/stachyose/melibiose transport system permease protein